MIAFALRKLVQQATIGCAWDGILDKKTAEELAAEIIADIQKFAAELQDAKPIQRMIEEARAEKENFYKLNDPLYPKKD